MQHSHVLMAYTLKINVCFQHAGKYGNVQNEPAEILTQIYCRQLYGVCTFCTTSLSVYYMSAVFSRYHLKLFRSAQWARFTGLRVFEDPQNVQNYECFRTPKSLGEAGGFENP